VLGTAAGTNYSSSMEFEEIFTFSSTRKHLIYSHKILVLPPAVIRPSPMMENCNISSTYFDKIRLLICS
jgi:hypothetical protein